MKKNLAIVFGISENYVFALANTLIGLKKHNKVFWDDIIVYHVGVSKQKQKEINNILKCKFIDFNDLAEKLVVPESVIKEYSLLTFARFECFNLLKEYKNVMWQDVDILIQKDISELIQYGQKTGFAATTSVDNFFVESNFEKLILEYDMFKPLYNAGILCLNDKLADYESMAQWCYDNTAKYTKVIRFADQGIINLLIQEYNIEVEPINILKYCCHPLKEEAFDACIIHAYGSNKFWNYTPYLNKFPEWQKNDEEWQLISSDYKNHNKKENINVEKEPLVSVIMSVYNRYNFLKEAMESILNQTYKNLELIIVVEKSDNQLEIIKYIEQNGDNRVKVLTNKTKLGFSLSLNKAIKISKGKYLIRMDDDDISLENRIKNQVNFMENNKDIGIAGSWMRMFMKSNELCKKPLSNDELKIMCLIDNPFFHPTVIIRKKDIIENDLYYSPEYFTEDYELWTRAATKIKFANIDEILLKYRASGENATIKHTEKVHNSVITIMKEQFKSNLNLDFNNNELELLYGLSNGLYKFLYNKEESDKLLQDLINKILNANLKYKVYNQEILQSFFKVEINTKKEKRSILRIGKSIIKYIFKPIYMKFIYRMENLIDKKIFENNLYMDYKINKAKNNDEI